jgi:hypothetical protein
MNTTRRLLVLTRQLIICPALAISVLAAPVSAILADAATATAAPAMSTVPTRGPHHGGPDYWSITGAHVGAPSEGEVSMYGGSHKHLWVEQQLYGPGVVDVPHVDTTVHQSR